MINVTLQRRPYARTRRETLVCKDAIDTCGYVRSDHRDPILCLVLTRVSHPNWFIVIVGRLS